MTSGARWKPEYPRASWQPEYHKIFVELCVEHKGSGHLPGMQHLLTTFVEKTGARFTINQLKNHYDTMLKQWKVWLRLIQCRDMKWDPQTKTFGATDQDWANYIQVNREAQPYWKKSPPLFLEELEIIFEGVNLYGEGTSSDSRKRERDEGNDAGDEASLSAPSIGHPRTLWSSTSHDIFVDLLFQESSKIRKPTRLHETYPKETWDKMVDAINLETGASFTRGQLKNRWAVTRQEWRYWCQAIGAPILKWDSNTEKFGATDEDWENFLKLNSKAAMFRWKTIPHAKKLATIFKGRVEPGNTQVRSYRRRVMNHSYEAPQLHEPAPSSAVNTQEPVTGGRDDRAGKNVDKDHEPIEVVVLDSEDETETPVCHRFNTEMKGKSPVDASTSVQKYDYTIPECMECLDAMAELKKGSELYMFALDMLMVKEHRQIFLLLKTSTLRMSWLNHRRRSV
ncbi:hypothetical protein CARUB_v10016407mg [Capsella rubella]|uniref:Myb/SANT-like domain-containing protein n=1 Tax=Capsella rubella TaxID=81985 RepID=R0I4Y8_9BRAS|nr:L10-interacting MYB domain-containing protein [Capsella rubella]EOA33070.1 hypothetical protein CARUB_v10016407mg [Capsella rubella]